MTVQQRQLQEGERARAQGASVEVSGAKSEPALKLHDNSLRGPKYTGTGSTGLKLPVSLTQNRNEELAFFSAYQTSFSACLPAAAHHWFNLLVRSSFLFQCSAAHKQTCISLKGLKKL